MMYSGITATLLLYYFLQPASWVYPAEDYSRTFLLDVASQTTAQFASETYHGMLVDASMTFCPPNEGCVDGPRMGQWLGLFMTATNDVLVNIGEAGSTSASWSEDLDRWSSINAAQGLNEQMDFAVLGISGELVGDASNGPPYPTIQSTADVVRKLSGFAESVYCIEAPEIDQVDVPALTDGQGLTSAEWAAFKAQLSPALQAAGCTMLWGVWRNWEPTGVWRGAWTYPDFHPDSQSGWAAAGRVWFSIYYVHGL